MKVKDRNFKIEDIDCIITIEVMKTQKDILECMDEFIENIRWFESANMEFDCDDTYEIIYKDGTEDYIDMYYDGHKIKRRNIASIVNNNDCTAMVYGNFCINENGVVGASIEEEIAEENITELK